MNRLFTYYGGKMNMVKEILPLIPTHTRYIEPFCGSAAIFFAKKPAQCSILNDHLPFIQIVYRVAKTDTDNLRLRLSSLLHHEKNFKWAKAVLANYIFYSDLEVATAFIVASQLAMFGDFSKSFTVSHQNRLSTRTTAFDKADLLYYLDHAVFFSRDALKVLAIAKKSSDFVYVDPPYIGTNCGHYSGYSEADYALLLKQLGNLKANFMLSSFPNPVLEKAVTQYGWVVKSFTKAYCVKHATKSYKTELLVMNYQLESNEQELFKTA